MLGFIPIGRPSALDMFLPKLRHVPAPFAFFHASQKEAVLQPYQW
jgi:hypothetical protein